MPLSIAVVANGVPVNLPPVPAGETITLTDLTPGKDNIVVIHCNEDDDGGAIYRLSTRHTRLAFAGAFRVIQAEHLVPEAVIDKETYEMDILTRVGSGTLRIGHITD